VTPLDILALGAAGAAAGAINTVVGSGSLITFPTLLALGYAPVLANVTNTVGIFPGSVSGIVGYRRELRGGVGRAVRFGMLSTLGSIAGALLLLQLPESAFDAIVPALILIACVLVAIQPRLSAWLTARQRRGQHGGPLLWLGILLTGAYGGYFGAAQGVLLIALLAIFIDDDLQRLNALKNVLAGVANGVAAVVFILISEIAWGAAASLAVGAIIGAQLGATVGRRLPPPVYRTTIVLVGVIAATVLIAT
jgi:uncharacterized membrane protein YfcA